MVDVSQTKYEVKVVLCKELNFLTIVAMVADYGGKTTEKFYKFIRLLILVTSGHRSSHD